MVENKTQIKSGITINANVSVKIGQNFMCATNIIFGIQLYVVAKMVNIKQVLLTIQ